MKRVVFSIVLVLMVACVAVAQDIRYNFDKNTDFSKFKSYKWVALKGATPINDLTERQIKAAVDSELAKKGLNRTDREAADLFIGYQAAIGQEQQFTSFSSDWGYGGGWYRGGWYGGPGMRTTTRQTSTIYTGQLGLDMYDSTNHTLVWRGLASKTIDPKAKPDKQERNLNKAVAKLLKNYPPQSRK